MPSRIRHAWLSLARQVSRVEPGTPAFLVLLRDWLRGELGAVSKLAAEALPRAEGIQRVLHAELGSLPVSVEAAREFGLALREWKLPTNPMDFVRGVDSLCSRLAVFRIEDVEHDACPRCQSGDRELWTDGSQFFQVCDFMGCCFDAQGAPLASPPDGLRPANRAEVLGCYPSAPLVSF